MILETSLGKNELFEYIGKQMDSLFPDDYSFFRANVRPSFEMALDRIELCYSKIKFPGYRRNGNSYFSHLYGDQYTQLLYYLSRSLWERSENKPICDKMVNMIRIIGGGLLVTYKCKLPDIFTWIHPSGTIIGNAIYNNYLTVFQNCTIEARNTEIGKGVLIGAGAKLIGDTQTVGDFVMVGAGTTVYKEDISDMTVVYRDRTGKIEFRKNSKEK